MTYTVEDEQTTAFAPDGTSRVPRLPDPPRFDDGDATELSSVDVPPAGAVRADDDGEPTEQWLLADPTIYREAAAGVAPTEVQPSAEEWSPEEQKLAAERAARRSAREQALAQPDVRSLTAPEPIVVTRRSTDRFLGSFALFVLRIVVAAIMAIRGLEIVTNVPAAEALFAATVIPEPRIMALVTGVAALAIAVSLVFGLLTRVSGLGVVLIGAGALVFVQWGAWSPFVAGRSGFLGELELLLTAAGLVLLCIGAGGFSLDRSFRKSREKDRLADEA